MKLVQIPKKKKGEYRTICIPDSQTKEKLRLISSKIDSKIHSLEENGNISKNVIHGFHSGKSPVSNAWQHVGFEYTLSMDLKDFFDSVKPEHVNKILPKEIITEVFIDGYARQGLPSSPSVCNIAAIKMDNAILKWIKKKKYNIVYTRYADDLSFSFNERELFPVIKNYVIQMVGKNGFSINKKKTRLQWSKYGRREITGLMVDDKCVHTSRKFKRKMRAALHNKNLESYGGMEEWNKCKLPNEKRVCEQNKLFTTLNSNGKFKNIIKKGFKIHDLNEIKKGDYIITNDISYIWGMTDLSDGWTSCYRNNGCNSNAPLFLSQFDVSIGGLLSHKTIKYYGVKRRQLKARCIIYKTRKGERFATGFYGGGENIAKLKHFLSNNNISLKYPVNDEIIGYGSYYPKSTVYNGIKKVNVKMKSGKKLVKLKT